MKSSEKVENLVLQYRGPQYVDVDEPTVIPSPFSHRKKLFVVNVPMNWDMFWILNLNLLDATPALESLHVHIDNSSEKTSAGQDVQVEHRQLNHLKELVVTSDRLVWPWGCRRG